MVFMVRMLPYFHSQRNKETTADGSASFALPLLDSGFWLLTPSSWILNCHLLRLRPPAAGRIGRSLGVG
jgi:hypothetical protein